jgi:methionyl-tRNA synthetase
MQGKSFMFETSNVPLLQAIFNKLDELGQLKEQESQQLFSEAAGKFLADRLVSGTCPKCGYEVIDVQVCLKSI